MRKTREKKQAVKTHYLVIEYNSDLNCDDIIESWSSKKVAEDRAKMHEDKLKNLTQPIPDDIWNTVIQAYFGTNVDEIYELFQASDYPYITKKNIEDMLFFEQYELIKDYISYHVETVKFYG